MFCPVFTTFFAVTFQLEPVPVLCNIRIHISTNDFSKFSLVAYLFWYSKTPKTNWIWIVLLLFFHIFLTFTQWGYNTKIAEWIIFLGVFKMVYSFMSLMIIVIKNKLYHKRIQKSGKHIVQIRNFRIPEINFSFLKMHYCLLRTFFVKRTML